MPKNPLEDPIRAYKSARSTLEFLQSKEDYTPEESEKLSDAVDTLELLESTFPNIHKLNGRLIESDIKTLLQPAPGKVVPQKRLPVSRGGGGTYGSGRISGQFADPIYGGGSSDGGARAHGQVGRADYRSLFGPVEQSDWEDLGTFARSVITRNGDPRITLQSTTGFGERGSSIGGFTVPVQYASEILDYSLSSEIIRPRARNFAMDTETLKIASPKNADHSDGTCYAGFSSEWLPEAQEAAIATGEFRSLTLTARKLALYTKVSVELMSDSSEFSRILKQMMAESIGWSLDRAFLVGTGLGQPQGILNAPSLVAAAKEQSQTSGVNYSNLSGMLARLHPSSLNSRSTVWIASPSIMKQLLNLTITLGDSAVQYPAYSETDKGFQLFGFPLLWSEHLPEMNSQGDIILVDLSKYAVGLRAGIAIDTSDAVHYRSFEVGVRAWLRVDGMALQNEAHTLDNSSTTHSWAVALEARS